ncbi:hypothetical protein [Blastococcus colisei]|uniref:hypothetical protein n=1 Tax=Blastococcus colisei TaxID=1564162 RepID=UPI003CCC7F4D
MVEVPALALRAREVLAEVDFVSIEPMTWPSTPWPRTASRGADRPTRSSSQRCWTSWQ